MAANFSKLQTEFEIELREQQKAVLAKENEVKAEKLIQYQILIVSLLLVLGLLVLVFLLLRNRQKAIQKRKLDEERWLQQETRTKAVIEAEERERQRIARELHDGVGQQLSAARLHLSALEGKFDPSQTKEELLLNNAISMMDDAVKEVRSVAHAMLANALLKQGLAGAVRDFIQKINSGGLIKIELEISGLDQKLDSTVESMLFRIIQEIMSNIIRHSGANQVTIQLHRQESELVLMVEDNGIGFDTSAAFSGAGMQNMKSRVEYINGIFEVDSSPGRGTTISVEVKI
jgi:signal transduction histidine kinase